jgi:uncharacterized SAM-binding protein YcdF (DUF218 family)
MYAGRMISGHGPDSGSRADRQAGPPTGRHRRVLLATVMAAVVVCALFFSGFGMFVWSITRGDGDRPARADAIVALTGGQGRIEDALELLSEGYGRRLLITGVNERTSPEAIKRLSPALRGLVECCVDLDYRARNTVGNAAEIRRWVQERGFRSLIVVTSDYHLPRTLAELETALPGIVKVPHAVVAGRHDDDWQTRLARGRIMLAEYVKFLAVSVRTRMAGVLAAGWQSATVRRGGEPVAERPRAG